MDRDDIMFPGENREAILILVNLGSFFAFEDVMIKPLELTSPGFLQVRMSRRVSVLIAIIA